MKMRWDYKVPTCVAAFDSIIQGGVPAGSLVLLVGDVGAGQREFAYTSLARLSMALRSENDRHRIIPYQSENIILPRRKCYVSISRSKDDVLRDVYTSFEGDFYRSFTSGLQFKDLSLHYFKDSIVPTQWMDVSSPNPFKRRGNLDETLVDVLEYYGENSMLVLDSATDLFTSNLDSVQMLYLIKGLQRMAKQWNGLVYLLLTKGVIDEKIERALSDIVDGVLMFEWYRSQRYSMRARYMYVTKFVGVMPHIKREKISRFNIEVSSKVGLVVADTERIG